MKPFFSTREQRLVWRLHSYWEERKADRAYPSISDIDTEAIGELWPHCFILDITGSSLCPYFFYLGPEFAKYAGIFLSGQNEWTKTLLDKAVQNFRKAVETKKPVLNEEHLSIFDGSRLRYRSILLPLSDGGASMKYILGAANGTRTPV